MARVALALVCFSLCLTSFKVSLAGCLPCRALAYFKVGRQETLEDVYTRFSTDEEQLSQYNRIFSNLTIPEELLVPFSCECLKEGRMGHEFLYRVAAEDNDLSVITDKRFKGLTKAEWIMEATQLPDRSSIMTGLVISVPVNCSCGNPGVSLDYGLFTTYVTQPGDTIGVITAKFNVSGEIISWYNPDCNLENFASGSILMVPTADASGSFPAYAVAKDKGRVQNSVLIGSLVGAILAILLLTGAAVLWWFRLRNRKQGSLMRVLPSFKKTATSGTSAALKSEANESSASASVRLAISGIGVEKPLEFSYEELSAATNDFNDLNALGKGGYGVVYYGYLRNQKLAVKKMNLQATKEFLAELKALSRLYHSNLVQLIGFCTEKSLFLVYEFVDNGTLAQHLHASERPPLSWASRLQIALDTARGLEYIHEHTKPTYIHRDVKSNNILIDRSFHAKVADFGLTKLTETGIGSVSLTQQTRLVGTFGYMSPEYARFGDVSPAMDVYSFGVVLFELLSAKEAIIRGPLAFPPQTSQDQKGLVTLFEDVLKDPDGREKLKDLIDPRLAKYPLEAAFTVSLDASCLYLRFISEEDLLQLAKLAGACTKENPELRPNMRVVVVALVTLSATCCSM